MTTIKAPAPRRADIADLDAIEALEQACFDTDAQSRSSLRYLLLRAHADIWLAFENDHALGYVCVLYRANSRVARIYSIAVDGRARGRGIGLALLAAAERAATSRGCRTLRAEVRRGNAASCALFRSHGYREREILPGYYAVGGMPGREDGLRLEKTCLTH